MGGSFEILAHPADIGFAFRGDTLEDAFVQAARALLFMLGGTEALQSLRFSRTVSIVLSAPDLLDLLFDWLSEILFFSTPSICFWENFPFHHYPKTRSWPWQKVRFSMPNVSRPLTMSRQSLFT